jgi:hypothetical protein
MGGEIPKHKNQDPNKYRLKIQDLAFVLWFFFGALNLRFGFFLWFLRFGICDFSWNMNCIHD